MINEHLTRQLDLIPLEVLSEKITIIGAGAIGGWTALSLAKMGFEDITVYDFDKIDTVNFNSQLYPMRWAFDSMDDYDGPAWRDTVGVPKVELLAEMVQAFTGVEIRAKNERYEKGIFPGIVIAAVDSMEVRRTIWENHKNKAMFTKAVIDPRMGAESALLYVMRPMNVKDQKGYEKTLYSDTEAVQERCTAKATIYTANLLSGLVVKAVKDILTQPNYLRSAQWDIGANDLICFNAEGQTACDKSTTQ